ncbi:YfiR family protein [Oligoflexia bacterium]|nr:YfiR family protein [Oligoflexia bacterium]
MNAIGETGSLSTQEKKLVAAYVYNIAKYTQWPAEAFTYAESPFKICLFGKIPEFEFVKALETRAVGGRSIVVAQLARSDEQLCHIIYFSPVSGDEAVLETVLQMHRFALSVGFERREGIVYLYWEHNKLRFDVDLSHLQGSGLKLSAQLLKLAANVVKE